MDPETYSDLERQIRELSEVVSRQAAAMSTMGRAIEESYNALGKMNTSGKKYSETQSSLNQAMNKNMDSMNARTRAEQKADQELERTKQAVSTALDGAGTALRNLGTAMLSTQQGFQKYNSTIDTVGNTAWNLGKNFGLLGQTLGGLTLLFSKLFQYQSKQADNLLSASDSLARMGAANGMSADQIRQMGKGAGLASTELEKMIKPMQSVQGGFIALGSTQAEGVKAFGGMINASESVRRSFLKLGLDDQGRIQMAADFVDYLNQSGQSLNDQNLTRVGLANAAMNYTKRIYTLAGFAGMDIETAKKRIAAANANQTVLLFGIQQKDKVNKLTEKLNSTTNEAERAAIQQEISQTEKKREQFDIFTTGLMSQGIQGDQLAALQAEYLTGVTTEASKGFTIAGGSIANIRKGIENGTMTEGDVAASVADTYKKFTDTYGEAMMLVPEIAQLISLNSETLAKSTQRTREEIIEAAKISRKNIEALLAGMGPAGNDPAQKTRGDLVELERKLKLGFDELAARINPLLGNFGALMTLVTAATAASIALSAIASKKGLGDASDILDNLGGGGGGKSKKGSGKRLRDPKTGRFLSKEAGILERFGIKGLARGIGRHAGLIGAVGMESFGYLSGEKKLTGKNIAGSAGGLAGAWGGAEAGAALGGSIGLLFGGVGAAPGALIGGLIGGGLGYFAGQKIGEGAADLLGNQKQKEQSKPQPANALQTLKSMLDQIALLQTYELDPAKVENNSEAISSYAYGLTAVFDLATAADSAKKADTIAKISKTFYDGNPPVDQFRYFSSLTIDPAKSDMNAKAFVSFANAMSQYKGGPGLSDSISSLFGKGFNMLFGQDGPVDAFRRFAKEDFGPNAASNADAFLKYAQASTMAGGGNMPATPAPPSGGGFFQQVKEGAAQILAPVTNLMSPATSNAAPPSPATKANPQPQSIPKARNGGIFDGPSMGYLDDSTPSQMVSPLNPKSILMKLARTDISETTSPNTTVTELDDQTSINMALYTMINEKIDVMNRILENSHDKHNRLLQVVKV